MSITPAMVKELRERTGAGMMDCKKALTETGGDIEAAQEHLRLTGAAKADKKSANTAAEGVVSIKVDNSGPSYSIVEINSQTDFASKSEDFQGFVTEITDIVLNQQPADPDALQKLSMSSGQSVEEGTTALIAKIGENIQVRRFESRKASGSTVAEYSHSGRIGVVCELDGGDADLAKDVAMHIAASNPICIAEADVPADVLEKEKKMLIAEAADSGKPEEIIEKMVQGRIKKYLAEITLVGQPFVKDPDVTVEQLLKDKGASVVAFTRFEVGEGIEKKVDNFADEVMAQVRDAETEKDD